MSIDVRRARAETPGCSEVLHFNNSGASLMPLPVIEALRDHLELEASIGGYEAEKQAQDAIEHTYDSIAEMINCGRDEIALVENATAAWCNAFYSIPFQPGDRILTAMAEYVSNYLAYLQMAGRRGIIVDVVPDDEYGQIDVSALEKMIDERVKLISITHVPTSGGLINPAARVGAVARAAGIPYLLDACQSAGQMPLDVEDIGCDMLSATSRKFLRGPRGTGFLYVRKKMLEVLEPPFIDLRSASWTAPDEYEWRPDARRFENWENYVAGTIGLGISVDYAMQWGLEAISDRVRHLAEMFREKLAELPRVTVRDLGQERGAIVTYTVDDADHNSIVNKLGSRRINCSVSILPHSRLDMERRGIEDLIRAPVHYFNIEDEVDRYVRELSSIIG